MGDMADEDFDMGFQEALDHMDHHAIGCPCRGNPFEECTCGHDDEGSPNYCYGS